MWEVNEHKNELINEKIGEFEINSPISGLKLEISLVWEYFEQNINWELEKQEKTSFILELLNDFLKQKNIKFSEIINAKIIWWGNLIINTWKETFSFDMYSENKETFYKWDEQEIFAENFELSEKMVKIAEDLDKAVDAMDYIFEQNDKEWFGELNDKNILLSEKFWKYLQGYNLNEIAGVVKKWFWAFDKLSSRYKNNHEANNKILKTKERFLNMTMWIWDKYEWAAEYIIKSSKEFLWEANKKNKIWLISEVIKSKSISELLIYIKDINKKIDENDYQSTPVEESYKLFSNIINETVFKKFKKENATEKQFLEFAKIISWKNEDYRPKWLWWEAWVDDNLSWSSESMEVLNDIVLHLMMRKWWIMEKINKSNLSKIEDEKIWNKDTYKIVNDFKDILSNKVWFENKQKRDFFIKSFWYWDILNIKEGQKYSDLTFEQKAKISVVYRVIEKINRKSPTWNSVYDEGVAFTNYKYSGEYYWWKDKLSLSDISNVFTSVAINASEEIVENMTDTFQDSNSIWSFLWWKDAIEFWLTDQTDIDIFNFFKDFQWVGALDFSDRSVSNLKTTGKFAAVIATAMAVVPLAWIWAAWAMTQWAVMWATATLGSIAVNPKWYDTLEEAITDISSDFVIWTVTWMAWWKLVQSYWVEFAKYWEKWFIKNKTIFAWDLMFLWLIPEAWRMMWVDWHFHKDWIFTDNKTWQID